MVILRSGETCRFAELERGARKRPGNVIEETSATGELLDSTSPIPDGRPDWLVQLEGNRDGRQNLDGFTLQDRRRVFPLANGIDS